MLVFRANYGQVQKAGSWQRLWQHFANFVSRISMKGLVADPRVVVSHGRGLAAALSPQKTRFRTMGPLVAQPACMAGVEGLHDQPSTIA